MSDPIVYTGTFKVLQDIVDWINNFSPTTGSVVSFQQSLLSGTQVGILTIDDVPYVLYAPTPPTDTSDLTNGAGFITVTSLPTKVSDLNNDENYTSTAILQVLQSGTKIATVTIDGVDTDIYAPAGGGGGSTVSWNQILQSGTKIAEVTIDGTTINVYAPAGGGGGSTVSWNQIQQTGTKIAEIDIDGQTEDVFVPEQVQEVVELTKAEYDALPNSKYTDNILRCIKDVYGSGNAPAINYSTEEQIIGTWIDGSTLYQKTYALSNGIACASNTWVNTEISVPNGVSKVINSIASADSACNASIIASCDNSTIYIMNVRNTTMTVVDFTIQYTKSSNS